MFFKHGGDPFLENGICRKNAPGPSGFPSIEASDFCGEFESKFYDEPKNSECLKKENESNVKKIIGLVNSKAGRVSHSELMKASKLKKSLFIEAVEKLIESGELFVEKQKTLGRDSVFYCLQQGKREPIEQATTRSI